MLAEMSRWVVVIFPESEELAQVEQLRRRYDPLADLIPAHITLVFPFPAEFLADTLRRHVEAAVSDLEPFRVRLQRVTGHEGEYLFLNVKQGNDPLIELHDRLYTGPLAAHRSHEHTFVPHLTVGRLRDRTDFVRAVAEVSEWDGALQTVVREVSAYRIDGEGQRVVELKIGLGGWVHHGDTETQRGQERVNHG
jgi:2'-5' RNA ligase